MKDDILGKTPSNIKTPDVEPYNRSHQPSASLQSVIKHNEDLMARLSVNLRRVGHLEKVIDDLTLRMKVEKANSDSLRDELLIYSEKSRLSESQTQKTIADLNRSTQKNEQLDIENENLKEELRSLRTSYEFKISQLDLEVHEFRKIVEDTEENLKPKLSLLEEQIKRQTEHLNETQTKNEELKEKLLNLSHQAQNEALKFQTLSKDLQQKLKEKEQNLSKYENLDEKLKAISRDKSLLENKVIELEHEIKQNQSSKSKELNELNESLTNKKTEIQKLKVENYELKRSWAESHTKSKELSEQNAILEEQAQSMKFMWQEKNRKISELESQIKIFETMRHELTLKSKNHDIEIKNKNEKINDLLELIETMKTKGQYEQEAILETAIRGMKSLYFEEDKEDTPTKTKHISF